MSEFETRFSGMKQAADQEKRLASEVTEIESEVRNVMNNLQIRSSAMAEIKRKLNGNLQNVSKDYCVHPAGRKQSRSFG